jgi:hypothetical protein
MAPLISGALKPCQDIDACIDRLFQYQDALNEAISGCSLVMTIYNRQQLEAQIKRLNVLGRKLDRMCGIIKPGSITDEDIEIAKAYPIEELIEGVERNMAICPFHHEKTPSLHIKNNKAYCYGSCKKTWDSVSFLMQKDDLSFIKAVRKLI